MLSLLGFNVEVQVSCCHEEMKEGDGEGEEGESKRGRGREETEKIFTYSRLQNGHEEKSPVHDPPTEKTEEE